jgi:hypothetical protein
LAAAFAIDAVTSADIAPSITIGSAASTPKRGTLGLDDAP